MAEPAASRRVYEGRHVRVDEEEWPGVGTWEVVRPLDAAAILALTPNLEAVLVRQFRPPVRGSLLEIPAGLLDVDDETPEDCARRELLEETGYRASWIEPLTTYFASPGHSSERVHVFLARTGARPEGEPEADLEVVRRPLSELVAEARGGGIRDPKTSLALLLAAAGAPAG
ncbi:MAG TPA: NUDIX hydrolase [Actinomycetota bacterium]|nr:NUDIX hydrolase [Actinomycetota bacterium]